MKRLGEWLEMEKKDKGIRMPMTDEFLTQINSIGDWEVECRLWKILEYDWLESVDKVRRELKTRESGGGDPAFINSQKQIKTSSLFHGHNCLLSKLYVPLIESRY